MLKNILFIGFIVWQLQSCKTIDIRQDSQTHTTQQVTLGGIGSDKKETLLHKAFNNTAIPDYTEPLKVTVKLVPFNKQTHKAFIKAAGLQSATVKIKYIDSVAHKPRYVKLQIADKVAVIDALNSTENKSVKNYLSNSNHTAILTGLSIALSPKDLDVITHADAVFLVEKGLKTYALQLYKNNTKTQVISFNQGVVFAYKESYCCWQENKKHQLDIVDLVSAANRCPKKTYRSAKRANKKLNTLNY